MNREPAHNIAPDVYERGQRALGLCEELRANIAKILEENEGLIRTLRATKAQGREPPALRILRPLFVPTDLNAHDSLFSKFGNPSVQYGRAALL